MMYEMHSVLKINEIMPYAFIMYVNKMYEMWNFIEMYLCMENKSLTNAGELWQMKSRTAVVDE